MTQMKLKVGDVVVVKSGVTDPDMDYKIEGWQGRISEIDPENNLICIVWDRLTLSQMSGKIIDRCEEEGMDWTSIYLRPEDVEPAGSHDNPKQVEEIAAALERKHRWSHLGEKGYRIQGILADVGTASDRAFFEAWEKHFRKALKFPFDATVSEMQERGPFREGDTVTVLRLEGSDDLCGVLVSLQSKRGKHIFPLCDLEVKNTASPNCQPVSDYSVWFSNR